MSPCNFHLLAREVTLKIKWSLLHLMRCGEMEPSHCWWEHEMVPLLETSVAARRTGKGRTLRWSSPITYASRSLPTRKENVRPHKNLYINVHKSSVQNSQQVQTTQCPSVHKWLHTVRVVGTVGCYTSMKQVKCWPHSTDEPWRHSAE